jgi:hypothetical protein
MRSPWVRGRVIAALLIAAVACSHGKPGAPPEPRPDPILVHVKNDNFLDMNIAVVISGVSRRLGQVTGNASADFKVDYLLTVGQSIAILATPIGGVGAATSGPLSVSEGQLVEFVIGSTLRQSSATVRNP